MLLGQEDSSVECNPDTLQMHCTVLNHLADFLILQDAVPLSPANPSKVEKLGAVHKS